MMKRKLYGDQPSLKSGISTSSSHLMQDGASVVASLFPPEAGEGAFQTEVEPENLLLNFANSATVEDLKKFRGITARKAMCFVSFRDNFPGGQGCRDLSDFQHGLGLSETQFEKLQDRIIAKLSGGSTASSEIEKKSTVEYIMRLTKSRCAPWEKLEFGAIKSAVGINLGLLGIRWAELNIEDSWKFVDCGILKFEEASKFVKVQDPREFCISRILDAVEDALLELPAADCYIFEESRVKSVSGGPSFVQARLHK